MTALTWDEFVSNVEGWAEARGIYEHSTPEAQLLKGLSELGEVADAIIKNDRDALEDGIGDVATCLVNYAVMRGERDTLEHSMPRIYMKQPVEALLGESFIEMGSAL